MTVIVVSLTPMLARLRVVLTAGAATGRVVGPRRPGHATVEVSYPLREVAAGDGTVTLEVAIPEPNRAPFEYRAIVARDGVAVVHAFQL